MKAWDSEGLWKKAKLFMDQANESDHGSSEFAFFASLALECLARSALTKVHPVLNADPRDDSNVLYACGYTFAKPRSLPAHSVYLRVEKSSTHFKRSIENCVNFLLCNGTLMFTPQTFRMKILAPTSGSPDFSRLSRCCTISWESQCPTFLAKTRPRWQRS